MGSFLSFAWHNLINQPVRTALSAVAVALGVAMILAADYVSTALLATLGSGGGGDMQITHGFIVEQFDQLLGMVGGVLLVAAAFLVFNAFTMSVSQRQQQIGALRALGMTRRQVLHLVLIEALLVGGAGMLLGLALGPLLGRGVVAFMQRMGGQFLAFGDGGVSAGTLLLAAVTGVGVALASALFPARRATRISPLTALHPQSAAVAPPAPNIFTPTSLAGVGTIIALFAFLAVAPPGRWLQTPWTEALAVALIVFWLLALGLLLPMLIRLAGTAVLRLLPRSTMARLVADNLQRSRGRVILTLLTLAVGLAMITGLTGFMTYAFDDLMGASIRRIAEENTWAVFPFDLEAGISGLTSLDDITLPSVAITAVNKAAGDRATVVPVRFALVPELSFFGDSYFTYVSDPEVIRQAPYFFQFTEGDWETAMPIMKNGCGALVAPLIAARQGVGLGDMLIITGPQGPLSCTIAGIGVGYVNASLVGDNMSAALGATQPIGLSIMPVAGADVSALAADLETAVAPFANVFLTPMADFAETQAEALNLFSVSLNGLLLLAVAAAALGVVNTTMMSLYERRRELGLLRAVGCTRRQIRQIVLGETALIGLLGALFGVVAGMGSVVIIVTTLGGAAWGVADLALWPAAGRALQPTLLNGVVGIIAAPLICALVARGPLRGLLRGTTVDTLQARRRPNQPACARKRPFASAVLHLAWRNFRASMGRQLLSAMAVALGTAVVVASGTISDGLRTGFNAGDAGSDGTAWVVDAFESSLQIVGVVILVAAAFLIFNVFAMAITQRQREIGMLRSLGMTRRQVWRLVLWEAAVLGVGGALLGVVLGPLLGNGLLALMMEMGFNAARGTPTLGTMVLGMTLGVGMTLAAVVQPAWQAMTITPLQAMRTSPASGSGYSARWQMAIGAALLLGITGYVTVAPPGAWTLPPWHLRMPLLLGVGWLTGLVLVLPALIGGLGRGLRRLLTRRWQANGRLVADNLGRARRRVTFTVLTFVVGLMMIVSLSGILTFLSKVVFTYIAEGALAQEGWEIYPFDQTQGAQAADQLNLDTLGLSPAVVADVYALANDRATVAENYMVIAPEVSAMVPNFPSLIGDLRVVEEEWGYEFVEGDWETARPILANGCGLLITPDVAYRHRAGVGDTITLQGTHHAIDCTVAGIGAGGVYPSSYISPAAKEAFGVTAPATLSIKAMAGVDAREFEAELQALVDRHGDDAWLIPPDDALMALFESSDMLIESLNGLLLLAVLAAALGVVNTTTISVSERRRELGLLRVVGATRRQVVGLVLGEAALIGLLGGLLGWLAGLALTFIFALSFGGRSLGAPNLPLWRAAFAAARPALVSGLFGLLLAPLLSMAAAWLPVRGLLHGTTVETLRLSHHRRG